MLWESAHHVSTAAAFKSLLLLLVWSMLLFARAPLRWFGPSAALHGALLLNPLPLSTLHPLSLVVPLHVREPFPAPGDETKPCPAALPKRRETLLSWSPLGLKRQLFSFHHR